MSDRQTKELISKLNDVLANYCNKEHCKGRTCHECQATTVVKALEELGIIHFVTVKKKV